jgi:hypothetical protein
MTANTAESRTAQHQTRVSFGSFMNNLLQHSWILQEHLPCRFHFMTRKPTSSNTTCDGMESRQCIAHIIRHLFAHDVDGNVFGLYLRPRTQPQFISCSLIADVDLERGLEHTNHSFVTSLNSVNSV